MGETNISRLVDVYSDTAKCDESVKAVLADKKEILNREYGIIMDDGLERRVEKMCNFSEVFFERGWDKGREEGLDKGIVKGKEEVAIELLIRGASVETVSSITKIPMERMEELCVK